MQISHALRCQEQKVIFYIRKCHLMQRRWVTVLKSYLVSYQSYQKSKYIRKQIILFYIAISHNASACFIEKFVDSTSTRKQESNSFHRVEIKLIFPMPLFFLMHHRKHRNYLSKTDVTKLFYFELFNLKLSLSYICVQLECHNTLS